MSNKNLFSWRYRQSISTFLDAKSALRGAKDARMLMPENFAKRFKHIIYTLKIGTAKSRVHYFEM